MKVIIPLAVLIPLNDLRGVIDTPQLLADHAAFSLALILSAAAASLIYRRLRADREDAVAELDKIRQGARDRTKDTEMESLGSEEIISHYFASKIKADEEIVPVLAAIRQAVYADGVHFFEPQGTGFALRCSTDEPGKVLLTGKGVLAAVLRDRKPFASGEIDEKATEVGYIRDRIRSLIVLPVLEGATPVGLLAVDSPRFHAFGVNEQKTAELFSVQITKILERERVHTVLKQDITALRIIKEFSARLASSIDYATIVGELCEYAQQAFSGEAFYIEAVGDGYRFSHFSGACGDGAALPDFSGTLIELAVQNRHKEYVSDTQQYSLKIFPAACRTGAFRSVIVEPLFYEGSLLGIFGMLSGQKDFLDSRKMSLVEVMCNQAATSIANARMHAEIERMATTDGLTGLFNHRVFQQKLSEELKRSGRHNQAFSLLLTDIDFFKKVNDTYGHPVGDLVLKGVAKVLRQEIRDIDIAARYGGEEFAVILPGTESEGARHIAERLRRAIEAESFAAEGRTLRVTTSIGIATVPADATTKEELIERADQALYHAKHNGRNQSVCWGAVQ